MAIVRKRYVAGAALALGIAFLLAIASAGSSYPTVQEYYSSAESQLGYWLLLGNARHCGLWKAGTIWPFPISTALRAMEEKVYQKLDLPAASKVVDAGMGSGLVASYMAKTHGLNVQGIDITPIHVEQAQKNIAAWGLTKKVAVQQGDYHNLDVFSEGSFDGIYTMETFVHADDPDKVLRNFRRLLRPGGVLVLHEADFHSDSPILHEVLRLSHCQNTLREGSYEEMLRAAGFAEIAVEDLTDEVLPLWRLFGFIGTVPYEFLKLFGLQDRFINIMAGVEAYRHWGDGRYVSIRAVSP